MGTRCQPDRFYFSGSHTASVWPASAFFKRSLHAFRPVPGSGAPSAAELTLAREHFMPPHSAGYWLSRAEEARTRADEMTDEQARQAMRSVVAHYEFLAERTRVLEDEERGKRVAFASGAHLSTLAYNWLSQESFSAWKRSHCALRRSSSMARRAISAPSASPWLCRIVSAASCCRASPSWTSACRV